MRTCFAEAVSGGALGWAGLVVLMLMLTPTPARADIISPVDLPLRAVGVKRPFYGRDPRFQCRVEAIERLDASGTSGASVSREQITSDPGYVACMAPRAAALQRYEAEVSAYQLKLMLCYALLGVGLVLGVWGVLRRRRGAG